MLASIPAYQTLGRKSGWRWQEHSALPYPLSHDRARYYYLGRNAVYHGARMLGLKQGDEVLFPSYHSGTEAAPLMHLGCNLRFYGVDRNLEIDLAEIESLIGPRTKAIYAIHFFGFPAPIEQLRRLANEHGLYLIEDVALGLLGHVDGRPLGTWGDISVFCMYKSLPVAVGGMLAVNNPAVPLPPRPRGGRLYSELNLTAKRLVHHWDLHGGPLGHLARLAVERCFQASRVKRNFTLESPEELDFDPGLLDCGMGRLTRGLLKWLDYGSIARRRRANYEWLAERLNGTGVALLRQDLPRGAVPLFLPILVADKFGTVAALAQEKIEAIPVWGIHHRYLQRGMFPGTEFLVNHAVEIPIFQDLSERHLERIARAVTAYAKWPEFASAAADEAELRDSGFPSRAWEPDKLQEMTATPAAQS
ncbi:MAG: DegT/DnrJ/EryC1/StrS family aminotransferase [Pirellulales bacterium]